MTKRQLIEHELETIAAQHDGMLRPESVVEFARDEATALHGEFEWDDSEAARKFRIVQARQLIRLVVNVDPSANGEPVRAFVSLSEDRVAKDGYRRLVDVMNDEQRRAMLLRDALRELAAFKRKYSVLSELSKVFEAAEIAVQKQTA